MKRIIFCLLLALAYFMIIIPVQSQQTGALSSQEELQLTGESNSGIQEPLTSSGETQTGGEITQNLSQESQSTGDQQNNTQINSGSETTGQISQEMLPPQLIISEIYYDGTDERIEITNLGDDFSGQVQLLTNQTSDIDLYLGHKQSILIIKSSQIYPRIDQSIPKIPINSLSFTDTKAIQCSLLRSGQTINIVHIETGLVLKYNDKKTSLQYQSTSSIGFFTGVGLAQNVNPPYLANPGYRESDQSSSGGDLSGVTVGGGTMTGYVDIPTPSSPQPGILEITEIYQSTGYYSSFIEIKAHQFFTGQLFFTGSLLKNSFTIETTLEKGEIFLIVHSDNLWLSDQKKQKQPSLDLNTSGFLYISGQSGQVFDSIQVLSTTNNKSVYTSNNSNSGIDIFSKIDTFSPGFDEKFFVYFSGILPNLNGQDQTNLGSGDQTSTGALSNSGTPNGQVLSGYSTTGAYFKRKDLAIIDLFYKTPESISIKSFIAQQLDLAQKERYLLTKETTTSSWKTTKKYLTGILNSGNISTISKTFGFLDAGSCVGLFYQTGQIDERCYGDANHQSPEEDPLLPPEDQLPPPRITILGVLPNPIGSDTQEELQLFLDSPNSITIPSKSLFLKVKTTKKYLTGTLGANTGTKIIGSLGLVNSATCPELRYKETLLDTFCYPDPQEGVFIDKNGPQTKEDHIEPTPDIHFIGLLPNPKGKDDQEQINLFWNYTGDDISKTYTGKELYLLNNSSKKYLTGTLYANQQTIFTGALGLVNKAHCVELWYINQKLDRFCYTNPKEDEFFGTGNIILQSVKTLEFSILQDVGFLVTGSKICVNYQNQLLSCRSLPSSKTSIKLKNQNKLYRTYVSLLQSYLMKDWSTLYYNTPLKTYFDTFKEAKTQVSDFQSLLQIGNQKFNAYDLSGQIAATLSGSFSSSGTNSAIPSSWRQKVLSWLGI